MSSGRKPGYTHSKETKEKIRQSLLGKSHPEKRKSNISQGKVLYDLDSKCARRLDELKNNYPEEREFFEDNEPELLFAMRDLRSEKELDYIRQYVETEALRPDQPYQYASSSCYAAEDAMIMLLDVKKFLQKYQ